MRSVLVAVLALTIGHSIAGDESPTASGSSQGNASQAVPSSADGTKPVKGVQNDAPKTLEDCLKLAGDTAMLACVKSLNRPDPPTPGIRSKQQNIYYQIDPEGRIKFQPTDNWAWQGPSGAGSAILGGPGTTGGFVGERGIIYVPPGFEKSYMGSARPPSVKNLDPSWGVKDWSFSDPTQRRWMQ